MSEPNPETTPNAKPPKAPKPKTSKANEARAHVIVIYEDTRGDGPRTYAVACGTMAASDAAAVLVREIDHEQNTLMVRALATRHIDELDLTSVTVPE